MGNSVNYRTCGSIFLNHVCSECCIPYESRLPERSKNNKFDNKFLALMEITEAATDGALFIMA